MKSFVLVLLFAVAPLVAFADDGKPLRHLEYSASTHYSQTVTSASYDGTASSMYTSGGNEAISVDVIAAASDGGLVVRASVFDKDRHRQHAEHTCAVYPNARVICPPNDEVESELLVLLSFLGRGFYDSADASNGTWTSSIATNDGTIVTTFHVDGPADATPVRIRSRQRIDGNKTLFVGWISDDDITYDQKMEVPLTIHDEGHMNARGGATAYSQIDFKLTSDSFARP